MRALVYLLLILLPWNTFAAEVAGEAVSDAPISVRHDVAQPSEPIVTLRYFQIRKGSFPEFLAASQQGVWPFFEKIGSRVVGMWQVIHPADVAEATAVNSEFDEVWLMTQYASVDHWRATRGMSALGGNGPDYEKALAALRLRRDLTIKTDLRFLRGSTWQNPPQFLPSVE